MKTDLPPRREAPPGRQADFPCPPGRDEDDGFRPAGRHENDRTTPNVRSSK